jgi:hypothetical protein
VWIAVALTTALAPAAFAPVVEAFPRPRPGLDVTLSGSHSWYPEQPFGGSDPLHDKVAAGYAAGGTLEWKLAVPFALETGLRYSLDTERRDYSFGFVGLGGYDVVTRSRLHRLGVPLRLRIALPFLHGLSAEGGAETQYLLQARRDDETHGNIGIMFAAAPGAGSIARPTAIIFESYTGQDDITSLYPRWNLALGGGLGWEFPLGRVTGLLRGRYQQGISDQTKTPDAKDFSRVGEMGLGVRW